MSVARPSIPSSTSPIGRGKDGEDVLAIACHSNPKLETVDKHKESVVVHEE